MMMMIMIMTIHNGTMTIEQQSVGDLYCTVVVKYNLHVL